MCPFRPALRPRVAAVGTAVLLLAGLPALAASAAESAGRVASEVRNVNDFQAIALRGSIDLVVRQGERESVEVRAEEKLLPRVETVVVAGPSGRLLTIRLKPGESLYSGKSIVVTVDVIRLQAVASNGSGDIRVERLKTPALSLAMSGSGDARIDRLATESLEVRLAGSGDVTASGTATRLKASVAGSGGVRAASLACDDVELSIAGSGDAQVTANKTLSVSIAGSGDVEYSGNAVVKTSVAGSGSVSRK